MNKNFHTLKMPTFISSEARKNKSKNDSQTNRKGKVMRTKRHTDINNCRIDTQW